MHDLPRQTLSELLAEHGHGLCDDSKKLEGLLKDLLRNEHRRETIVLIGALREGVVHELRGSISGMPPAAFAAKLTRQLCDNLAMDEAAARWTVESWAFALGVEITPPLATVVKPVAPVKTMKVTPARSVGVDLGFMLPCEVKNDDVVRRRMHRKLCLGIAVISTCIFILAMIVLAIPNADSSTATTLKHLESTGQPEPSSSNVDSSKKQVVHEESTVESESIQQVSYVADVPPSSVQKQNRIEENTPLPVVSNTPTGDANHLYEQHRYAEAISAYEQIIAQDKKNPAPKTNLARLLATCPEDRFRDGPRAVRLAMEAYTESNDFDWKLMCIAAAAYAEIGDFSSATYWAYKARRTPSSDKAAIDKMLAEFQMREPCRW